MPSTSAWNSGRRLTPRSARTLLAIFLAVLPLATALGSAVVRSRSTLTTGPPRRSGSLNGPPTVAPPPGVKLVTHPADLVNTFRGTTGGVHMYPGASLPFGMIVWSPDTPSRPHGGGYNYTDTKTIGLSLTHASGPGCGIDGDIPILPLTGTLPSTPAGLKGATESFSHADESASPGRYQVGLRNNSGTVDVKVAVTLRTGIGEFTFPPGTPASVLFKSGDSQDANSASSTNIVGDTTVTGSATTGGFCGGPNRYTVYYAAEFQHPFSSYGTWDDSAASAGSTTAVGVNTGAWVGFGTPTTATAVQMKVAISFVSVANAEANLAAEQSGWDYLGVAGAATRAWDNILGQAQIGGGTTADEANFYTALYGSLQQPALVSDDNGQYPGFDGHVHTLRPGQAQYSSFSGWDIYRSEIPLVTMFDPSAAGQMMASLVRDEEQGGWLPVWPVVAGYTRAMGGDSSDPILAEGYAFGAGGFTGTEAELALQAMVHGATASQGSSNLGQGYYMERPGLSPELRLGYVPNTIRCCLSSVPNGASLTEEYAEDDFAIAQLASGLGQVSTYQTFMRRAQNWENLFDPANGYILPRGANGAFPSGSALVAELNGSGPSGFQEGDASQYNFLAPQNLAALIDGIGGNAPVVARLNSLFRHYNLSESSPFYYAGNETDLETPWVYDYAGAPYLAQKTVRAIIDTVYSDSPGGEPGNDDLGALSSWELWGMLGMYPETPGVPYLTLASPLFPYTVLHLHGHTTVISAKNASETDPYVHSLTINGRLTQDTWVPLSYLIGRAARTSPAFTSVPSAPALPGRQANGLPAAPGGPAGAVTVMDYVLGATPDREWGAKPSDAPPSFPMGEAVAVGSASTSEARVAPGSTVIVPIALQNMTSQPQRVTLTATATTGSGLTLGLLAAGAPGTQRAAALTQAVGPRRATVMLPPDGRVDADLQLDASSGASVGFTTQTVYLSSRGNALQPIRLPVVVAPKGSILDAFDNNGITDGSNPAAGNFDGDGNTYPAGQLAAHGLTAGGTLAVNGISFVWQSEAGHPDNVVAAGQTITVDAAAGTTQVGFLGSASYGPLSGALRLNYSDGTSTRALLGLGDWAHEGGLTSPYGNVQVAKIPYRNNTVGTREVLSTYLFEASVPVNPAKRLASVTLPPPSSGAGELHIFAIGTTKAAPTTPRRQGQSPRRHPSLPPTQL